MCISEAGGKRPLGGEMEVKFDYHDPVGLSKYLDPLGKIKPRRKTGLTKREQLQLKTAVERARHLALLPLPAKAET